MSAKNTCLESLQNKIFKLLPMREDYDNQVDNNLYEYVGNLSDSLVGAMKCFPEFENDKKFAEVRNNIAYLNTENIPFKRWRTTVLRTVRIISGMLDKTGGDTNAD